LYHGIKDDLLPIVEDYVAKEVSRVCHAAHAHRRLVLESWNLRMHLVARHHDNNFCESVQRS
jgi:hypothetical protein